MMAEPPPWSKQFEWNSSPLSWLFFPSFFTGKVFVPKQKPIEARQEEVTTLDPELEEALSSATDTELCDLAGKNERTLEKAKKSLSKGFKNITVNEALFVCCTQCCSCENPSLCWDSKTQAPFTLALFLTVCDDGENERALSRIAPLVCSGL